METRGKILFLPVLTTLILLSTSAFAATLEVGSGKPYTTIQSAITAATTGDTILVYDGTYNEEITLGKPLIVKSVNGVSSTIIDATDLDPLKGTVNFSAGLGRDTVLDGFTIAHGGNFSGGNINCFSSPTIANCFVYGGIAVYGGGIACKGTNGSPLITNCVISANTGAYGGGIYCSSASTPTIINCTISQNRSVNSGSITDAIGAGMFCEGTATVVNTILWKNIANGLPDTIYLKSGGSVNVSDSDVEGGWIGAENINSNPQFAMPGYWNDNSTPNDFTDDYLVGGDFHLQSSSACIDAGTSENAPATDIEGTLRPQGTGYDMGAYEYSPSTLITLSSFTATPKAGEIILHWSTESETDNAGFNLYRSVAENGEYTKINASIIPAKGSSTQGTSYEFIDNNVQNRKTYYYKLEDIDLNGISTMHGPVSAVPRWIYGIEK
jgi:hypothetical protein